MGDYWVPTCPLFTIWTTAWGCASAPACVRRIRSTWTKGTKGTDPHRPLLASARSVHPCDGRSSVVAVYVVDYRQLTAGSCSVSTCKIDPKREHRESLEEKKTRRRSCGSHTGSTSATVFLGSTLKRSRTRSRRFLKTYFGRNSRRHDLRVDIHELLNPCCIISSRA